MLKEIFLKHPSRSFLSITFFVSWAVWIPLALKQNGLIEGTYVRSPILGMFGPLIAALLITSVCKSREGVDRLIRGYFEFKHILPWFLACLILPILAWLVGSLFTQSTPSEWISVIGKDYASPAGIIVFSVLLWGIGGEGGWRAHLMTHLEAQYGFLVASTTVFCAWTFWHAPLFFFHPDFVLFNAASATAWLVQLFCYSLILGWVFKKTHGNLLAVSALYGMLKIAPPSTEYNLFLTITLVGVTMIVVIAEKLDDSSVPLQYLIKETKAKQRH